MKKKKTQSAHREARSARPHGSATVRKKFYAKVLRRNMELESLNLDLARANEKMRAKLQDCAAYIAFHGPIGMRPEESKLLLHDVQRVLSPNLKNNLTSTK